MARFVCSTPPLDVRQGRESGGGAAPGGICRWPSGPASWWLGDMDIFTRSQPIDGLRLSQLVAGGALEMFYQKFPASWWVAALPVGGCDFVSWWVAALPVGGCDFVSWWLTALPVGGLQLCQLVALDCWQLVAWGLGIFHENFLGDTSAEFLYGKRFMGNVREGPFPIQRVVTSGVKPPLLCLRWTFLSRIGRWIYKRGVKS